MDRRYGCGEILAHLRHMHDLMTLAPLMVTEIAGGPGKQRN